VWEEQGKEQEEGKRKERRGKRKYVKILLLTFIFVISRLAPSNETESFSA
jgi:hypothetical protein